MAENKNENGTGKVEDATELSNAWLDEEDDDIVEEEETVYDGNDSNFIQGYGAEVVKIVMAKRRLFVRNLWFVVKMEKLFTQKIKSRSNTLV